MAESHLVRVGVMGAVGRFAAVDRMVYPRGRRVVVRTARGLEVGQVLTSEGELPADMADGQILRAMTVEDDLLEARLGRRREEALAACAERVKEAGLSVVLMDVEPMFDGGALYFYFLGDESPELAAIVDELAELYETRVQLRQFAETLASGCGPGCGTEAAAGQGCGSCSTGCGLASACGVRKH